MSPGTRAGCPFDDAYSQSVARKPPTRARLVLDVLVRPERHRYGRHRHQRADLYVPGGTGPHPVVVLIHGGSWRTKYGKSVMRSVAADHVWRDRAAWNVKYRPVSHSQGRGWPDICGYVAVAVYLIS